MEIMLVKVERNRQVPSIVEGPNKTRARRLCCSLHDEHQDEVLGYKYPVGSNENPCQENLTNNKSSIDEWS